MPVFNVNSDPPYEMFTAPPLAWLLVNLQTNAEIDSFFDWMFVRGQSYFGKWVNVDISKWPFDRFIKNWCTAVRDYFLCL